MSSLYVAECAEFPNDNPALHRGAIWRCETTAGPATFEAPVEPIAPEVDDEPPADLEIVDELHFDLVIDETARVAAEPTIAVEESTLEPEPPTTSSEPPPAPDAFDALVDRIEDAARAAGATLEAVSALRALLGVTRLAGAVEGALASSLAAAGLIVPTDTGHARSEPLTREVRAWQALLRGESDDMTDCGPASLDAWSAALVAAVVAGARIDALRRDLRGRGVAAFGLVEAA